MDRREWRDSLDPKWSSFLSLMKLLPISFPNDPNNTEYIFNHISPDYVLLSGGNDIQTSRTRNKVEKKILDLCIVDKIPVIGVCRGMQFINHYFKGSLLKCDGHVQTSHMLEGDWARSRKIKKVNSYHNYSIDSQKISKNLRSLAWSKDGVIKAIEHIELPWLGIMWHPEREDPFKKSDLKLFFNYFSK